MDQFLLCTVFALTFKISTLLLCRRQQCCYEVMVLKECVRLLVEESVKLYAFFWVITRRLEF
jgi:hypothetical protein